MSIPGPFPLDSVELSTVASAARAALGIGEVNPVSFPNLIAAYDFARSVKLLKTDGTTALEGDAVSRINDADGGPYYLEQTTAASQWLRSGQTIVKPATPGGFVANSIPINYRRGTIVVITTQRNSVFSSYDSCSPYLSSDTAGGLLLEGACDKIYGPDRYGNAWYDDAVNIKAVTYGTSSTVCYNNHGAVTLAANNAVSDTLTWLFRWENSATFTFNLPTRAIYIYDRQLTAAEIQNIRDYHAIQTNDTVIQGVGDSIVQGVGATTPLLCWAQLVRDNLGFSLVNSGVASTTVATRIAYSSTGQSNLYETGKRNVMVFAMGTNDLAALGSTATLQSNIQAYCAARKLAHPDWKIIVATILPRTASFSGGADATTFAADRTTVNTWIRANYASFADGLADYADLSITLSDGIHPNDAGHATIAATVQTAINALVW